MKVLQQLEEQYSFIRDPAIGDAIKEIKRLMAGLRGVVQLVDEYATHEDIAEFAEAVLKNEEKDWYEV